MLRKEMKENAQRALRGKYGKWATFVVIPVVFFIFCFLVFVLLVGLLDVVNIRDDYFDDDFYDYGSYNYDSYASDYTPAYNYGYALGYQAGYLKGWPNGLDETGTAMNELADEEILDSIDNRPAEFLISEEFEEGVIDAFTYSYYEAWTDARKYQSNFLNLSIETGGIPQPLTMQVPVSNYYDYNDDYYTYGSSWGAFALFAVISFAMFLLMMVASLLYRMLYLPLLQWAAIDTIDGEDVQFSSSVKELFNRLGVVAWSNFKIGVFTFLWSLLFVIPGLIKQASYSMTNYLLKREPELDSTSAIVLSQKLMDGYKMEYLIFLYSFFWWYLATAYSLGFVGFYVLPYYYTAEAIFFDQVYFEKRLYSRGDAAYDPEFEELNETF